MSLSRRLMLRLGPAGAAAGLLARLAGAQTPPRRIRGTIEGVDGQVLHLTSRAGEKLAVRFRPDTPITAVVTARFSDIGPNSFIGTAARPRPDGSIEAIEIHVFPESMRGTGEGHRPYDLEPQSTMTNGTVGSVLGSSGRTLRIDYAGGVKTLVVPEGTPIVTFAPGSAALLKAGAHVIVFAATAPDGGLTATRILAGQEGLTPPM